MCRDSVLFSEFPVGACRCPHGSAKGAIVPKDDWTTAVGEVAHGVVNVRGYPISEIIAQLTFADVVYLTVRGELPTQSQRRVMDAALCSIVEHGLYAPTTLAARIVASATPQSIIPAVAAGMLTIGSITVSPQHTAEIIDEVQRRIADGQSMDSAAHAVAADYVQRKERMPGLGHPLHPEGDPRAEALGAVAREQGQWSALSESYLAVRAAYLSITNRSLPVNIDGMLGCVLRELGFNPLEMPGIAAISFMPGVVAHSVEEVTAPPTLRVGYPTYTGPNERHVNGRQNA
jgi:citryl-CoA lyase